MPNVYYLLHDFDPSLDMGGGAVVSLFPNHSYRLENDGVPYTSPHDYYDECDLRMDGREKFRDEMAWYSRFDDFLKRHITNCRLNDYRLATTAFTTLKYMLDEIAIECHEMRAFLSRISPGSEVCYVRHRKNGLSKNGSIREYLHNEHTNWYYDVLRAVVAGFPSVTLRLHEFDGGEVGLEGRNVEPPLKAWLRSRAGGTYRALRGYRDFLNNRGWAKGKGSAGRPVRVFALHAGSAHTEPVLKRYRDEGFGLYVLRDGRAYDHRAPGAAEVFDLRADFRLEAHRRIKAECEEAAQAVEAESGLFAWIDGRCGFFARETALPFLRHFVRETCRDILCAASRFSEMFDALKFDYLIGTNSADDMARGALLAAGRRPGIRTVGIQHGIMAYDNLMWVQTDLKNFGHYFASDPLSAGRFRKEKRLDPSIRCEILQSAHYLRGMRAAGQTVPARSGVRTVLYVPSKVFSYLRSLMVPAYGITWYYEYQKKLMDVLGREPGIRVIYKEPLSARAMSFHSIHQYIRSKGYSNISLGTKSVKEYLAAADAVLVDRPLTAFFESAASGRPVLCLLSRFMSVSLDPEARAFFGDSIRTFATIDEGMERVREFVRSDGARYRVSMDLEADDLGAFLGSFAGAAV